jgi:hypothetical protein
MTINRDPSMSTEPGRSCPLRYRYSPAVFRRPPDLRADTLYVIGGLYGNVEALHEILAMKAREEVDGLEVSLFFNGDFNWFDIDGQSFDEINETVLTHAAIQGNVEAELDSDDDVGCGCAYPSYVDQAIVDYSNAIIESLRACAGRRPELVRRIAALPMHALVEMGGENIGIIHGDPESLAGWGFAVENLHPLDRDLRSRLGCTDAHAATTAAQVAGYFGDAQVRAFACTHTCLPFMQDFSVGGQSRMVVNNGSAGMPNFRATTAGLITRFSVDPRPPATGLYGSLLGNIRVDAIPVAYDHEAWLRRFAANWPTGSAAERSYAKRIADGPEFFLSEAVRLVEGTIDQAFASHTNRQNSQR